jgi:hypothetical protein
MNTEHQRPEELSTDAYLIQFSVVISGETHNPTILNPDFLTIRNIVPSEWGWDTGQAVTTPALSVVSYTNGLSITVEPNKLQIVDPGAAVVDNAPNSKAAEIARRYVGALPHVRYTAVGTNFFSAIEHPDPQTYVKNRFLKQGRWDSPVHPLNAVGLRLAYPLPNGRLLFSLDTGQAERVDAEQRNPLTVIFASANFNRDCSEYPADKQIDTYLGAVADDWITYTALLRDTLEIED